MRDTIEKIATSEHFTLQRVANGVYAAVSMPGTGSAANAGIVDLGDRALIFDTFHTSEAAQDLRSAAEYATGKPVAYVVNSHWHRDHVNGNKVFAGEAEIISSKKTSQLMSAIDTALPTKTFDERMVIRGSRRTVEILTYGGGHTESDVFLYVKDQRVAFMGDLLQIDHHPKLADGKPKEWLNILEQVAMLDINKFVPGHGMPGTMEDLPVMYQYIIDLHRIVDSVIRNDGSAEQLERIPIPFRYDDWASAENFIPNLKFLFEQAK